jgi:hypothetical protein
MHFNLFQQLREKLEVQEGVKFRTAEYRSWQKDFLPKKKAVSFTLCFLHLIQIFYMHILNTLFTYIFNTLIMYYTHT